MSNEKKPFEYFDGDSLDEFLLTPDRQKNIDALMDSVMNQFRSKFKDMTTPFVPQQAPTLPLDLDALAPAPHASSTPIWEKQTEKTAPAAPAAEPQKEPEYPPIPEIRPKRNHLGILLSDLPTKTTGTLVPDITPEPVKMTQEEIPNTVIQKAEPISENKPKTKKVNTEDIEKRYKDRQEKLGDLFKNRGQIS